MQPYQKVAPHFKNLYIPILPSKAIDFLTFKTQFLLPTELEVDLFVVLPPFSQQKILLRVVLAYKRGTNRNTKTTTTTTITNTKTRLFLGFSSIKSKSLIK